MGKPLLICFAVPEEARFFKANALPNVQILITGMGRENARRSLLNFPGSFSAVISAGFAGGINPSLKNGEVVFNSVDTPLVAAAAKTGLRYRTITTIDRVCVTAREKSELFRTLKSDAVDMESDALKETALKLGLQFAIIKVISDAAHEDMPLDFNRFFTSDLKMNFPKLIAHILLHPGRIGPLLHFQKGVSASALILAKALQDFSKSLDLQ